MDDLFLTSLSDDDIQNEINLSKEMFNFLTASGYYVVSVIGSCFCPEIHESKEKLKKIIVGIIHGKDKVIFLVTRDSDLGRAVSEILHDLKKDRLRDKVTHILMLPYATDDYIQNISSYIDYYTWVVPFSDKEFPEICSRRDRYMVDKCDILMCHFPNTFDKRFKIVQYADSLNKPVLCI